MARKKTKFPENGVQFSDFKRTRNMAKKDRAICKTYIDGILADVEKRDRSILDMGEQLTKIRINVNKELRELKNKKDYEIGVLKNDIKRITALKLKLEGNNATLKVALIISLLFNLIFLFLIFANKCI